VLQNLRETETKISSEIEEKKSQIESKKEELVCELQPQTGNWILDMFGFTRKTLIDLLSSLSDHQFVEAHKNSP